MLHRRPNPTRGGGIDIPNPSFNQGFNSPTEIGAGSSSSASTSTSTNTPPKPTMRRPSSGLYTTPINVSSPRARYKVPSPSPGLSVTPPKYPSSPVSGYGSSGIDYSGLVSPNGYGYGYGHGSGSGYGIGYGTGNLDDNDGNGDGNGNGNGITEWLRSFRLSLERMTRGLGDAIRLDRSLTLVFGDAELRSLVIKSTLINLLSLLLLSLFPVIASPILYSKPSAQTRTKEIGMWYNLLLSWPVFVVCFWINAYWSPAISKRAQSLLHPTYRHQPSPVSTPTGISPTYSMRPNPFSKITASVTRLLLISDFQFVSRVIALIPIIGHPLSMLYMSVIDAYYFFDSSFNARGWPLDHKVEYMQERVAYMIGFGFPATFMTSFGPILVNMAFFALLYPLFVIQALQARPPTPKSSLLPSTPSPRASLPTTPVGSQTDLANNPFFNSSTPSQSISRWSWSTWNEPRLPIFVFARYALDALSWLEAALMRDRKGSSVRRWEERAGKRLN